TETKEQRIKPICKEVFSSMDLTSTDFSRLATAANVEISKRGNGNYLSPMLSRDGEEVIFQENTVGIIRQATVFNLKDREQFSWSNPSVFIHEGQIVL